MKKIIEKITNSESLKMYGKEIVEKFTKDMICGNGTVFNPEEKGNNTEFAITETFVTNFEEKVLFLRIYNILIKELEEERRSNKINFKNTQRAYSLDQPLPNNHINYLDKDTTLPVLYETRHFLKSKFNRTEGI